MNSSDYLQYKTVLSGLTYKKKPKYWGRVSVQAMKLVLVLEREIRSKVRKIIFESSCISLPLKLINIKQKS